MHSIYIHSSGRSGSNRLLDYLDTHERTLCRNEVNVIDGDFARLPSARPGAPLWEEFLEGWRTAIARARRRNSFRDRFDRTQKLFLRAPLARWGQAAMARRRLREAMGVWRGDEWAIPGLWYRRDAETLVVPVVKIGGQPDWVLAAHAGDPGVRVLHNMRRPDRFLASWWNRYVRVDRAGDVEQVFRESMAHVPAVLEHFGVDDHGRLASFSLPALVEAELWLWRYENEVPWRALSGQERYCLLWYEDISADPEACCREAFAAAGLEFTEVHAARVRAARNTLFTKRHDDALDAGLVRAAVEHVLGESPLWPMIEARM